MEKKITISLTSVQRQDDDEMRTELITPARLCTGRNKDEYSIVYEDTEATGFEGSTTTITVDDGKFASIVRRGTANSLLSLETGRKHFCQYGTPFGNMQIGVFTHDITDKIREDGTLYMKYTLDLNSSYLSDNEIILKIQDHSM